VVTADAADALGPAPAGVLQCVLSQANGRKRSQSPRGSLSAKFDVLDPIRAVHFYCQPLEVSWRSSFDEVEYFPVSPPRQLFDGRPDPARPDQLVVKPIGNDYLIIFRWRYWRVMPRRKDVAHAQSRMAANPGIFDRDGFRIVSIAYYSLVNPLPNFAADASWMIEGAQDRKTIAGLPFTRH
jgi:hypothetical protein